MTQQSIHRTSRQLLIIVCLFMIVGCGHEQEKQKLQENNNRLQSQIDSLNSQLDSIKRSPAILFERTLSMKSKSQTDSALKLFKSLYKIDSLSPWGVLTEKKIAELSSEIGETNLKNVFEPGDTLLLFQENSKCGEWGGDTYSLKLFFGQDYSKGFHEGEIIGKLKLEKFDCESLIRNPCSTNPKDISTWTVKLTSQQEEIVMECIHDLLDEKLTNPGFISHSGIINKTFLKSKNDTTLLIEDYPSNRWNRFHELINILKKK